MTRCIFCKRGTSSEPVEHIALEGLFGHQRFSVQEGTVQANEDAYLILDNDQVCGVCNDVLNRKLDHNLQKQLGLLKVLWNGQGTKRGNAPKVERPGLYAMRHPDGPRIVVNGSTKKLTTADGVTIHPPSNHPDAIKVTRVEKHGNVVRTSFDQPMRMDKRFVRALYKIAFELLCFAKGAAYVLDYRFDDIREYVRYGRGSRCFAFDCTPTNIREVPTLELCQIPGTRDWVAAISIFFVDLTPDNTYLKNADENRLREELLERKWDGDVPQGR